MASPKQAALAKARARRLALDEHRADRDRRVEDTTAQILVLLEERAAAEAAVQQANARIATGLRTLLDQEAITVEGVSQLCALTVNEVRRLSRAAAAAVTPVPGAQ